MKPIFCKFLEFVLKNNKTQLDDIENYLNKKILPDLERGRSNFDRPHTVAVVYWLKQIISHSPELNLDRIVLLIAAYAHDWGYADMFSQKQQLQYDDVKNAKVVHMKVGAEKLQKLLNGKFFSFLDNKQKKRCVHLVAVHDNLDKLKDKDELVLMEADTLGALDVSFVKPTFDFESNEKYMQEVQEKRLPKFITKFAKEAVKRLIQRRVNYYLEKKENSRKRK